MTVALVANIARPISSAISTAFSADSYGPLSSYGLLGASANPDAVIEALFASGEQGAWYDPSDLSTMFQDSAGTTPVTGVGQPVGLILDKSKGLMLGPELVVNGTFDSNTAGWTPFRSGVLSIVSGRLRIANPSGGGNFGAARQPIATEIGKWYQFSVFGDPVNNTSFFFDFGISFEGSENYYSSFITSAKTTNGVFLATATTTYIELWNGNVNDGAYVEFDNISVKELAGNHASQDTAASRPLLQNDGVNNYLAFDGVDDNLVTGTFALTQPITDFFGFNPNSFVNNRYFFDGKNNDSMVLYQNGTTPSISLYSAGSGSTPVSGPATGVSAVATAKFNGASSNLRIDAQELWSGSLGSGNANGFTLGSAGGGTAGYINARFYSIIVLGREATPTEITDTETWVNSKTGAY